MIEVLQQYKLPQNILPCAPNRFLFACFSEEALAAASDLTARYAEKRGVLSHIVRFLSGVNNSESYLPTITIEAHIDGRDISTSVSEELLKLGFEPDGFVKYHPDHFNSHSTLKFGVPQNDPRRRKELFSLVRTRCEEAFLLLSEGGRTEAYLELETYPNSSRRFWADSSLAEGWLDRFPFDETSFRIAVPTCEGEFPPDSFVAKRADVHIKIGQMLSSASTKKLVLDRLQRSGFYHVITWASHDICTAEFNCMRDAMFVFGVLSDFFDRYGGATEMTLENVVDVWRTSYRNGDRTVIAAVPPLVVSINGCRLF